MAVFRDKSPFPGMDPYLDRHWPDVHLALIALCRVALNDRLPGDLVARGQEQVNLGPETDDETDADAGDDPADAADEHVAPDLRVEAFDGGGTAVLAAPRARAVKVPTLRLKRVSPSPRKRRWIEISRIDGERLVTVIELLSPANKIGRGRRLFLDKRRGLLRRGVNVVEIDLVRDGPWRRLVPQHLRLPDEGVSPYRVLSFLPGRGDVDVLLRPIGLRHPLPAIDVPLRPGEEPVELELQPLIDQAYVGGRYGRTLDYARPPEPPLSPEDAAWAAGLFEAEAVPPA